LHLALASSSNRLWVDTCLAGLGFTDFFEATVAGDEVIHGKPAPEIYLRTAQKLAIPPERCLVVEDAPHGVASAKAATMLAVAVDTEYTRDIEIPSADLRVRDLGQLLDDIRPALAGTATAGAR
jgi:16S rRNA pseudouridine516 synthase